MRPVKEQPSFEREAFGQPEGTSMRKLVYCLATAFTSALLVINVTVVLADPSDQQVNDTRAFIEYTFGFQLDASTVQLIRTGLTADMTKNESGSLATLNDMNTFMSYVH